MVSAAATPRIRTRRSAPTAWRTQMRTRRRAARTPPSSTDSAPCARRSHAGGRAAPGLPCQSQSAPEPGDARRRDMRELPQGAGGKRRPPARLWAWDQREGRALPPPWWKMVRPAAPPLGGPRGGLSRRPAQPRPFAPGGSGPPRGSATSWVGGLRFP